jgi:ubiquinone/menaquinone biosynthesis C-methylase UbiE
MDNMNTKLYPESGVELTPFTARNYDRVMNIGSFGKYTGFIRNAIEAMNIGGDDQILDLGCGTGRNAAIMESYLGENGHITGVDISKDMEKQFLARFKDSNMVDFINQRIDRPFDLVKQFDKIFISFVIHGFPHEVRDTVIKNIYAHLKPGGSLFILDFAEFDMDKMPALHRFVFKKVECIYAFDYIRRNWKTILSGYGFGDFSENLYLKKYVRLLRAVKH